MNKTFLTGCDHQIVVAPPTVITHGTNLTLKRGSLNPKEVFLDYVRDQIKGAAAIEDPEPEINYPGLLQDVLDT